VPSGWRLALAIVLNRRRLRTNSWRTWLSGRPALCPIALCLITLVLQVKAATKKGGFFGKK
jgi:hypothetical protein